MECNQTTELFTFDQIKNARNSNMSKIRGSLMTNTIFQKRSVQIEQTRKRRETICSSIKEVQMAQQQNTFDEMYVTMEKLGEGAHGVVKRCVHKESKKEYAVKMQKMDSEHIYFLKRNFLDMKKLKHPSIIKYKALYFDFKKNMCYLVMELLNYKNLIESNITSEEELRFVFQKILAALEYLHSHFMCHRDIKPENILYSRQKRDVKIIDFGVGKNMKLRGRYEEMLTITGTEKYRAPEMFLGGGYSESIDLWAVGVTLYELIAGSTPFQAEYHHQIIEQILHDDLDFQEDQHFDHYSYALQDFIAHLLKKDVKARLTAREAQEHVWFDSSAKHNILMNSTWLPLKTPAHNKMKNEAEQAETCSFESSGKMQKKSSFEISFQQEFDEEFCLEDKPLEKEKKLIFEWVLQIQAQVNPSLEQEDEKSYELEDSDSELDSEDAGDSDCKSVSPFEKAQQQSCHPTYSQKKKRRGSE